MNPYLSVHNNPINFIDPLGLAVDADSLPRPDDPSPPSLFASVVGGVGGFFGSIANLALGGQVAHAPPPGQTSAERRAIDETNTDAQLQGAVNLGSMVVAGPVGRAVTGGITSPLLGGYANAATQGAVVGFGSEGGAQIISGEYDAGNLALSTGLGAATAVAIKGAVDVTGYGWNNLTSPEPTITPYGNMKGTLPSGMQADHINQTAAFRGVIPRDAGLTTPMEGSAFVPGTQHNIRTGVMDAFFEPYRQGGVLFPARPTVGQHNTALKGAYRASGMTSRQASFIARSAAAEQASYGLTPGSPVPFVPGRTTATYTPITQPTSGYYGAIGGAVGSSASH